MSRCIKHERCPECAKKGDDKHHDNLGIYEDGSAYCFKCGYVEGGTRKVGHKKQAVTEDQSQITFPYDATTEIHPLALQWLAQYKFTREEILKHGLLWSEWNQRLIFPIKDQDGQLIGWTGRYIEVRQDEKAVDKKIPKWYTKGFIKDNMYILYKDINKDHVIIVEDIISGIVLNRFYNVLVLFGSIISKDFIYKISMMFNKVVVWLDRDKFKEGVKYTTKFRELNTHCIHYSTIVDPKEYAYQSLFKEVGINGLNFLLSK